MKTLRNLALSFAAAAMLTCVVKAVPITGSILFSGTANLDTSSVGTATAVTGWHLFSNTGSPFVSGADGSFLTTITAGPAASVTFAPTWSFNYSGNLALWTVGGFTFNLTSSSINTQDNTAVDVRGVGMISGNGFTPTAGTWAFSTQNPSSGAPAAFSFSASGLALPDSGSTLALLGGAFVLLAACGRRMRA